MFVWFVYFGVVLKSFFPTAMEVDAFYCRNRYFWLDLLVSSLIFMNPLRIDTQCGLQIPPPPISLASDHPCDSATLLLGCSSIWNSV